MENRSRLSLWKRSLEASSLSKISQDAIEKKITQRPKVSHIYWLKIQVCGAVVIYELTYPILRAGKLVFHPLLDGHIIFSIILKTLWTSSWYFSSRICSSVKFLNMAFRIGFSSGSEFVSAKTEDSVDLRSM